uniref:Uncharacterized protein n=1 Tax=Lactuca sativa TaxID=4236 RepID=A0A9R1VRG7_LACSA|nr:hypothetical protein LSAT_V11C400183040 [Lactuca sativa]
MAFGMFIGCGNGYANDFFYEGSHRMRRQYVHFPPAVYELADSQYNWNNFKVPFQGGEREEEAILGARSWWTIVDPSSSDVGASF